MLLALGILVAFYLMMALSARLYVKRVTWAQSLIWPYYFVSDVYGKGFDKRPL